MNNKKNKNIKKFNEYFAGVIDADGSLLISKTGYGSLEITMDIRDEKCLRYLQNHLIGAKIKNRSGVKAIRLRVHNKEGMLDIINKINGLIHYPQRKIQLKKLCDLYGIPYIEPKKLDVESSYFSGILDGDGTITMSLKKNRILRPQLTISVTSKNKEDLIIWTKIFKGNIYENRQKYKTYYKWSIQSKKDILNFLEYLKKNPLHTLKKNRVLMIPQYYNLYEIHAFKVENEILYKKFINWTEKWSNYGYSRLANISLKASETK